MMMLLFLGVGAVMAQTKQDSTEYAVRKKHFWDFLKSKKSNTSSTAAVPSVVILRHPETYQKLQHDFNIGKISEEEFDAGMVRYLIENMKAPSDGNCFSFKDILFQFQRGWQ